MPSRRIALATLAALLCAAVAAPAQAHGYRSHGHARLSFHFGVPFYPYHYYHAPRVVYAYPPVVVAPAAPTTYIEQPQAPAAPAQAPSHYWHYCADSNAYYPYVQQCAGGWQRVSPTPPGN